MRLCAEVNGNQISSVMMVGIGRASYFIDGPNSENVVSGGMVLGHGGNTTVIKTTATWRLDIEAVAWWSSLHLATLASWGICLS